MFQRAILGNARRIGATACFPLHHSTHISTFRFTQSLPQRTQRTFHTAFLPSKCSRILGSGLGKASAPRASLGIHTVHKPVKVEDPWGIEARAKRMAKQETNSAESAELDGPLARASPEDREAHRKYIENQTKNAWIFNVVDAIIASGAFPWFLWIPVSTGSMALCWFAYVKLFPQRAVTYEEEPTILVHPKTTTATAAATTTSTKSTASPSPSAPAAKSARSEAALAKVLENDADARAVAQFALQLALDDVPSVKKQIHGKGGPENDAKRFASYVPPPAAMWEARAPVIRSMIETHTPYADYVGEGHFQIYSGVDTDIQGMVRRIEKSNPAMPFTWQVLKPAEIDAIALGKMLPSKAALVKGRASQHTQQQIRSRVLEMQPPQVVLNSVTKLSPLSQESSESLVNSALSEENHNSKQSPASVQDST